MLRLVLGDMCPFMAPVPMPMAAIWACGIPQHQRLALAWPDEGNLHLLRWPQYVGFQGIEDIGGAAYFWPGKSGAGQRGRENLLLA
jgi:hypothetical protein